MAIWVSTLKITLTLLLSGLVVVIIAGLLNLRFTDKSLYEILLSRKKIMLLFLALLILLMPAVFSLPRGTGLSPEELVVYVRELLISVVIVVLSSAIWKVLNVPASISRWFEAPHAAVKHAIASSQTGDDKDAVHPTPATAHPNKQSEMELDQALQALDGGEIAPSDVKEIEQALSLVKWMHQGDIIGWYELWEEIYYGDGLRPRVRSAVERELRLVRQERHGSEVRPTRNGEYEKQLQSLLSPQMNKANEVEQYYSWNKWIQQKDDTGWEKLLEVARFGSGLSPGVRSAVRRELRRLQREASKRSSQSSEEKENEQRLQFLLSPQSVE